MSIWFPGRTKLTVPCTVDVEHTHERLHAHVDLDGVILGPGDEVQVHGAPTHVSFGEHVIRRCTATITRAGWLEATFTRMMGHTELTELYEVGFSDGRAS